MKLKTVDVNGKTYAELSDGKPVYMHDDGKEVAFDGPDMYQKLTRDGKRNAELQRSLEETQGKLKAFEGIADPETARKAIEALKNIDEGKLLSAGKVEEIKVAAKKSAEEQVAAANKANMEKIAAAEQDRDQLRSELYKEIVGGSFARSKFIGEKIAIPADLMQARFEKHFDVKDGKIVGKDAAGNPIYSRSKPGEIADFEEAMELLVESYPQKNHILKGTGNKGDGARGGNGAGSGGAKTMTREQFNALDVATRQARMRDGYALTE